MELRFRIYQRDQVEVMLELEGQFLHEQVHVLVNLEPVQVIGVALEPHEKAAKGDICREAASSLTGFIALDSVDFAMHDVFKAVSPTRPCFQRAPLSLVGKSVLSQAACEHQSKLVC